jgi:dTDP-4-amino-4,6-dideoxygalactose transaminase
MQCIRESIVRRYQEAFRDHPAFEVPPEPDVSRGDRHAWHLYVLRLRPEALTIDRDAFIEALRDRGVGTSVHFIPASYHPVYHRELGIRVGDFPVAEAHYRRCLTLPLYPRMSPGQVEAVIERVVAVADRYRR